MARTSILVAHRNTLEEEQYVLQVTAQPTHQSCLMVEVLARSSQYTIAEVQELVQHCSLYGIKLLPEIDMPGHWGAPLNFAHSNLSEVVRAVLQEVAAMIPSPLLHLGGDEPDLRCWEEHEERENETGYPEPLESFQRVLDGVLEDAHIPPSRVIRWGDVGNTSTTPRANIVQAWRDRGHRLLERGHELIVSWGWYYNQASNDCLTWMDCYQGSWCTRRLNGTERLSV
eukprot:gene13554-16023_t